MASSPSIPPPNPKKRKYDVFLSFRGEDTRHNFTSHLYSALCRQPVETFMDEDGLNRGEENTPTLMNVIKDCKIAVIVFSKDYASSSFCLDEVAKIIECHESHGQMGLPIFLHVDPSDVSEQRGSFEIAFSKHYEKHNPAKVEQWKNAFSKAASISGLDSNVISSESTLVDKTVEDICQKLEHVSYCEVNGLVRINSRVQKIVDFLFYLKPSEEVLFLGIWGLGGVGKTTLAEAVFHRIADQFEGSCFLARVRERSESDNGLWVLCKELLSRTLELKEGKVKITTPNIAYSYYVRQMLSRKSVLVVLDDVNCPDQLESLAGDPSWFGAGSRIIVTSRDKHVLQPTCDVIYKVEELDYHQALELFNLHAFKKTNPTQTQSYLSKLFVKYASGIPLALKVLGSYLNGRNDQEWESAWEKLKKEPHQKIQSVLRLSYDSLDHNEKRIFVYLVCWLKNHPSYYAKHILKDYCGLESDIGFSILEDRCLIGEFHNGSKMHDLVVEMGKKIVREESKNQPNILWDYEGILEVLTKNTGTEAIEVIFLEISERRSDYQIVDLNPIFFAAMTNLNVLQFHCSFSFTPMVDLSQGLESLPNELRLLFWHYYPCKTLPANFHPGHLVKLELRSSKLEELPMDFFKHLNKLKYIDLSFSEMLRNFPSTLGIKCLEDINLYGCSKLEVLSEVSRNIKSLKIGGTAIKQLPFKSFEGFLGLRLLSMSNCFELKSLPADIHKLKFFEEFNFSGCINLEKFPENLETMDCLTGLNLGGTAIKELPTSIVNLQSLSSLYLNGCRNIVCVPDLPLSLVTLHANNCASLANVSCIKQLFEFGFEDSPVYWKSFVLGFMD